jgi:hypothetical protein
MQNRFLKFSGIILCVIFLLLGVLLIGTIFFPDQRVIVPHIAPDLNHLHEPPLMVSHHFPFEKNTISLILPVNSSVYEGAKQAEKATTVTGNISEHTWLAQSYNAMIQDPAQEIFYTAFLAESEKIRLQEKLTDDEYLEFITVYVQSLRYETRDQNPAKFPIETVVDNAGDCDDKSLLLAGLLSRVGYPVALFLFEPESHMAVGIGSDDYLYKNTGYAFVETTNFSFIGVPTDRLEGNLTLYSDPVIFSISNSTKFYAKGGETRYIHEMYDVSGLKVKELEPQVKTLQDDLVFRQEKISRLETFMQELKSQGNTVSYNAQVPVHNGLVGEYNARLNMFRQVYAIYEKYARIRNYILEHQYDRRGVYEYLKTNMAS